MVTSMGEAIVTGTAAYRGGDGFTKRTAAIIPFSSGPDVLAPVLHQCLPLHCVGVNNRHVTPTEGEKKETV